MWRRACRPLCCRGGVRVPVRFNGTRGAAPGGESLLESRDIYGPVELAPNSIRTCLPHGIVFVNGVVIETPNEANRITGALLLGSDAYEVDLLGPEPNSLNDTVTFGNGVRPLPPSQPNAGHVVEFAKGPGSLLSLFKVINPRPEVLVVGLGKRFRMLHPDTKEYFHSLGIKVEVSDTRNACAVWDMLTVERRGDVVGALLLPPNL